MKCILILTLLVGCSQVSVQKSHLDKDQVSLGAALDQAQFSYMKGCVDAYQALKIPKSFEDCRDKSILHRNEIKDIIYTDPI